MTAPDKSQLERAEKLRARIMAAHAICAIAESDARAAKPDQARQSFLQIDQAIDEVSGRLLEPGHLSSSSALELRDLLTELQGRTRKIQSLLKPPEGR